MPYLVVPPKLRLLHIPKSIRYLLFADLLVVLLHVFMGYKTDFFNLDNESNFPTYYQGLKLLIVGSLLLHRLLLLKKQKFLIPLALLTLYLGVDEIFQLHENFGSVLKTTFPALSMVLEEAARAANYASSKWIIYMSPFIAIALSYAGMLLFRISPKQVRPNLVTIFTLYLSVIVLEMIGSSSGHTWYEYQVIMTLEETCEMLGTTAIAYLTWFFSRKIRIF